VVFRIELDAGNIANVGGDADNCIFVDNITISQLFPALPEVTSLGPVAPGQFGLQFRSQPGADYEIWHNSDLVDGFVLLDKVRAEDVTTTYAAAAAGPSDFFRVVNLGVPEPVNYFEADFESTEGDNAWVAAKIDDGTTSSTAWERGAPGWVGDDLPNDILAANSPENAWGTGLMDHYQPGTNITVSSPAIDLSNAGEATLRWYQAVSIDTSGTDAGYVRLKKLGDDSVVLDVPITDDDPASAVWEAKSAAVPAEVLGTSGEYYIEFGFVDDGGPESFDFGGLYIDDVRITNL
jgi:hypothetical protein